MAPLSHRRPLDYSHYSAMDYVNYALLLSVTHCSVSIPWMSHALFLYTYSSSSPVVYKEDSAGLCSSVILSQTEDLSLCSLQPSRFRVHQVVTHVGGHKDAVVAHIAVVNDGEESIVLQTNIPCSLLQCTVCLRILSNKGGKAYGQLRRRPNTNKGVARTQALMQAQTRTQAQTQMQTQTQDRCRHS